MKKQYHSPAISIFTMPAIVMNANSVGGNAGFTLRGEGNTGDVARGRGTSWYDDDDDNY